MDLPLGLVTCRVFRFSKFVLDLAGHLVGLPFGLQLTVASNLAGCILDGALDFFAGVVDSIPYPSSISLVRIIKNVKGVTEFPRLHSF